MAKGEYAVVGGTTRKIKKEYAVIGGVTRKIKRKYAVIDGVTRLIWTGSEFKLVVSSSSSSGHYPIAFSDDGGEYQTTTTNLNYMFNDIINIDGVLYGLNATESVSGNGECLWYLYKSTDGGLTWSLVKGGNSILGKHGSYSNERINIRLRYLDGTMYIIGLYNNGASSLKSLWYSTDLGVTWTSRNYTISSTTASGDTDTVVLNQGAKPLDLRYGTVGGVTGYYLFVEDGSTNSTTQSYMYKFINFANGGNRVGSGMYSVDKAAISIKNNELYLIAGNTSGTYYRTTCYKYTGLTESSKTQVKAFMNTYPMSVVASNSEYMVGTCGTISFKFDGTTVTEGGSVGSQSAEYSGTFAATFVNGSRVFAFKPTNQSGGNLMYSDNYGESWTILSNPSLGYACFTMCSTTDSYV